LTHLCHLALLSRHNVRVFKHGMAPLSLRRIESPDSTNTIPDTYTDFFELEKEVGGHGMQDCLFILPFSCAERVLSDDSEASDRRDGKRVSSCLQDRLLTILMRLRGICLEIKQERVTSFVSTPNGPHSANSLYNIAHFAKEPSLP